MATRRFLLLGQAILLLTGILLFSIENTQAGEGMRTGYALGKGGPMAGVVPPPGLYISSGICNYSGKSDSLTTDSEQHITASANVGGIGLAWVPDVSILGAGLSIFGGIPYGKAKFWVDTTVHVFTLSRVIHATGESNGIGDPSVGSSLGWHSGDSHWSIYGNVTIPIGDYEEENVINLGHNRWQMDVGTGYTFLNFSSGFEASGLLGFVFNAENPDTNYTPGIEGHFEAALLEHFSNRITLGAIGYYYRQLTEDDGVGSLGNKMGQIIGAGPMAGYFFMVGQHLVSINVKWFHEFKADYRLEGDSVFTNLVLGF